MKTLTREVPVYEMQKQRLQQRDVPMRRQQQQQQPPHHDDEQQQQQQPTSQDDEYDEKPMMMLYDVDDVMDEKLNEMPNEDVTSVVVVEVAAMNMPPDDKQLLSLAF